MSTLKDIARTAGVSLATASRVLNGGKGISQKTCDHVLQIAKDLNYIPNLSAKILAGKNSKMIGMIVPEIDSIISRKSFSKWNTSCRNTVIFF